MTLEIRAHGWLRWERRCKWVLHERSPRSPGACRPDVIGITKERHIIEVEVKRTLSDFRANSKKPHVVNRAHLLRRWPRKFFYIVPATLIPVVLKELPEWAGLLASTKGAVSPHMLGWVTLIKEAPTNKEAARLSTKECVHGAILQGNQVWKLLTKSKEVWPEEWEDFQI